MPQKPTPPKKGKKAPAKKPSAKTVRGSKVASAVANPARYSATRNVKIQPYDAKWKAGVKAKREKYDKSLAKKVGVLVENFTPLAAGEPVMRAITGKDFKKGKGKGVKTKNRLGDVGAAALYLTPFAGAKRIKKTVSAVRKGKAANEISRRNRVGGKLTAKTRHGIS